jgi:cysteinyl-tRNA synthetase
MNDDFNTSVLIAQMFELARIINSANDNKTSLTETDIEKCKSIYQHFMFDVCGLKFDSQSGGSNELLGKVIDIVLDLRNNAKAEKNFAISDDLRDKLLAAGIKIKDSKEGSTWTI